MTLVIGSLQLGFLYGILALGIYVTFRILNIPDLTAEGSFTLGLAASAVCTLAGHPVAGIVAAAVAGALAGCVTGVLQTKMGIHAVLAGILTMCGLYTINLIVMEAARIFPSSMFRPYLKRQKAWDFQKRRQDS